MKTVFFDIDNYWNSGKLPRSDQSKPPERARRKAAGLTNAETPRTDTATIPSQPGRRKMMGYLTPISGGFFI
jgi:hypothetical protein